MKFGSLYITWREMKSNVQFFADNLIWGYVKLDYTKLGKEGLKYADELEEKIKSHMYDDYCYPADEDYRPKHLTWLYDFVIKARTHGALVGEFRDKL